MKREYAIITAYAVTHFVVDFACASLFFSRVYPVQQLYIAFLLYNFCAFALQMPLGLLADKFNKNALCAAAGCALVALAFLLPGLFTAALFAGVGNALFHIGGGIDVLNISSGNAKRGIGKAGPLGVFVSPGALGLFLGKLTAGQGSVSVLLIIAVLMVAAGVILYIGFVKKGDFSSDNVPVSLRGTWTSPVLIAALCFFLVVCLRSYAGMTLSFPWKSDGSWRWALIAAVVLGKTVGGFAADRFGAVRASTASLGLSALLFLFSNIPAAGVAALFLFNMTMPVTLWAMARLFSGAKGFSFGVLTFGLFLGFVPVYLGCPPLFDPGWGFAMSSALSLVLLVIGLKLLDLRVYDHSLAQKHSRGGA